MGEEHSFVMADIPGLIEGAHEGAGLGHDFLRHVDRCRLLLHLVDVSGSEGRDPVADIETIHAELAGYSEKLAARPEILVANKVDLLGEEQEPIDRLRKYAEDHQLPFAILSAATGQGVKDLMNTTWQTLQTLPPVEVYETEYIEPETQNQNAARDWTIEKIDDYYIVSGAWVDKIMGSVNIEDYESRQYMDRMLQKAGIYERLEQMGIQDGDFVVVGDIEFEYIY